MVERIFASIEALTSELERQAVMQVEAVAIVAEMTSIALEKNVKAVYGDQAKLAPLSMWTVAEREKLGYTPDDPLLRDGRLLRDSMEREAAGPIAAVGSPEPIAAYHEFGYINARTGNPVPARPTYRIGLEETMPEAVSILAEATFAVASGLKPRLIRPEEQ